MPIVCPDKSKPEWKSLIDGLGDERKGYLAFFRNGEKIPELARANEILRPKSQAPQLTPLQVLEQYEKVKVTLPKGATMVRLAVHHPKTGRAKDYVTGKKELESRNVYAGNQISKVEAGTVGRGGEFVPMTEPVKVEPVKKQASLATKPPAELQGKPTLETRTPEQLREMLPKSGLDDAQQNLIRFFLDSPVASALDGIRVRIADTLDNGWQGSYFQGLVELARNSDTDTPVHEFGHRVWELLPDDVKQQFGEMRRQSIEARLKQPMNYAQISQLERLRDHPTSGGGEFMSRGFDPEIYPYSSDEEYFTHSFSDAFQDRLTASQQNLWQRARQFFRDLWSAVKQYAGLDQSKSDLLTNIINGRFKLNPQTPERTPQASLPNEPPKVPKDTTQVMGKEKQISSREHLTESTTNQSIAVAKQFFDEAKVPVNLETIPDPRRNNQPIQIWVADTSFDLNPEGRKLIEILKRELPQQGLPGKSPEYLASLLSSIRYNSETGRFSKTLPDGTDVMSLDVRRELMQLAQTDASWKGQMLAALSKHSTELGDMAHDPLMELQRTWYQNFGGNAFDSFFKRVLQEFGKSFTDDELAKIAASKPEFETLINQILSNNARDEGGRVFRIVQNLLKPKKAPKLKTLIDNARVREAADNIIEQARQQGIEEQPKKGRPLSPIERMLDLIQPKTQEKMNGLIKQAVADGERAAGIKAALNETHTEDERNELQGRFDAGEQPTPEQIKVGLELPEYEHWKIIRDNLLGYSPVTEKLASKIVPKITQLARQILETPEFMQPKMRDRFIDQLTDQLGLAKSDAQRVYQALFQTYDKQFKEARQKALDNAKKSLTPREIEVMPRSNTKLWQKIERLSNAGGLDTADALQELAKMNGQTVPTPQTVSHLKELADREQALRTPTDAEYQAIQQDPALSPEDKASQIAKRIQVLKDMTRNERAQMMREMGTIWSQIFKPLSWKHWFAGRDIMKNNVQALNEYETLDMLTKIGFPFRILTHITTQLFLHTPTRSLARARLLRINDIEKNGPEGRAGFTLADKTYWRDVGGALSDSYKATIAALKPALISARAELLGRGETRNVDRVLTGMNTLDRIAKKADEEMKAGRPWNAAILHFINAPRVIQWYISAVDHFQGKPTEYQELIHRIEIAMRDDGRSRAEIESFKDVIFAKMRNEFPIAVADTQQFYESRGIQKSDKQIEEEANNLVTRRVYEQMARIGLPADDFEADINLLKSTVSWQEPTTRGIGGGFAGALRIVSKIGEEVGVPTSIARLSNAIGTGINYALMNTPFYKLADIGPKVETGGNSPWFRSRLDREQRLAQAVIGSLLGSFAIALVASGRVKVVNNPPLNKKERDDFYAQGHHPGTVEFYLPDGSFIPLSLTVGPASLVAPYFMGAGAVADLVHRRAAEQQKLNDIAARTGMPAGKIRDINPTDIALLAGEAALGTILSARTASGLTASLSEQGIPNSSKAVSSAISPLVPLLPAYQELSRMMGVSMDSKLASIWDYLVPLPTSAARSVNMLGDPVKTPDDVQRIIQTVMAGSYPLPIQGTVNPDQPAYAALFSTDYRPPPVNPMRGYNINGTYRPMTDSELEAYSAARGAYFKQNLSQLGSNPSKKDVQTAFHDANTRALGDIGATITQRATGQTVSTTAKASPAASQSVRRVSLKGVKRAPGTASAPSVKVRKLRRPSRTHVSLSHVGRSHISRPRTTHVRLARPRESRPHIRRPRLYA